MDDKKVRRLSKTELLWIIHDQEEEIIELKEQMAQLKEQADRKAQENAKNKAKGKKK